MKKGMSSSGQRQGNNGLAGLEKGKASPLGGKSSPKIIDRAWQHLNSDSSPEDFSDVADEWERGNHPSHQTKLVKLSDKSKTKPLSSYRTEFFDLLEMVTEPFDAKVTQSNTGGLMLVHTQAFEQSPILDFNTFLASSEWEQATWADIHSRLTSTTDSQPRATSAPQKIAGMETQSVTTQRETAGLEIVPYTSDQHDNGSKNQSEAVPDGKTLPQNRLLAKISLQIRQKLKEASKELKGHHWEEPKKSEGKSDEKKFVQSNSMVEDEVQLKSKVGEGVQPKSQSELQSTSKCENMVVLNPVPRSFCPLTTTMNGPPTRTNDESTGLPTKKSRCKTLHAGELHLRFKLLPGFAYIANVVDELAALQLGPPDTSSILPRLPLTQRLEDWTIERRQRVDGRYDLCYYHKESNVTFRSTLEVSDFVVYNIYPSTGHVTRRRKSREETREKEVGTKGENSCIKKKGKGIPGVEGHVEIGIKKTPNELDWDGDVRVIGVEINSIFGDMLSNSPSGGVKDKKRRKVGKSNQKKKSRQALSVTPPEIEPNVAEVVVADPRLVSPTI